MHVFSCFEGSILQKLNDMISVEVERCDSGFDYNGAT